MSKCSLDWMMVIGYTYKLDMCVCHENCKDLNLICPSMLISKSQQ